MVPHSVVICISLMINGAECLLSDYWLFFISLLKIYLCQSFAQFEFLSLVFFGVLCVLLKTVRFSPLSSLSVCLS